MSAFSIPLGQMAEKLKLEVETVARKSTFELWRAVQLRSPVDTGRFRANWNPSFGSPNYAVNDGFDNAPLQADSARSNFVASQALTLPIGGVTYLSNGLPYAVRLEFDAWSKQAPAGMIRIAALEYDQYVRKALAA